MRMFRSAVVYDIFHDVPRADQAFINLLATMADYSNIHAIICVVLQITINKEEICLQDLLVIPRKCFPGTTDIVMYK